MDLKELAERAHSNFNIVSLYTIFEIQKPCFMKAKHALVILAAGYCTEFVAAMFKLEHWEYGDELIIFATVFKVVGLIMFISKLLTHPKTKEFLNW